MMSIDRELTEKAAKIAGVQGAWNERQHSFSGKFGNVYQFWDPLNNAQDCMTLAAKLQIDVRPRDFGAVATNLEERVMVQIDNKDIVKAMKWATVTLAARLHDLQEKLG